MVSPDDKSDLTSLEQLAPFEHPLGQEEEIAPSPEEDLPSSFEESDLSPPFEDSPHEEVEEAPPLWDEKAYAEEVGPTTTTEPTTISELITDTEIATNTDLTTHSEVATGPEVGTIPEFEEIPEVPAALKEVGEFAQNYSYTPAGPQQAQAPQQIVQVPGGGGPYFTIILKQIRFKEDATAILDILKGHNVLVDEKLSQLIFETGQILIPRLSEFAAIFLLHQLRRFNVELLMGPSEELHPSQHFGTSVPPVSKHHLKQNRKEGHLLSTHRREVDDIIVTTASYIQGYEIVDFLGVITETLVISEEELLEKQESLALEEDEQHLKKYLPTLKARYDELAKKIQVRAFEKRADAVIGLHYQLTPLLFQEHYELKKTYQISCTGSMVLLP